MDETRKTPAPKQSWGALIAVVIIVAMVCVGAYYAWNKRTAPQYPDQVYGTGA